VCFRITAFAVGLLLFFGAAAGVRADKIEDRPEVIPLYNKGKRMMREADWLEAARIFEELAGRYPDSKNLDLFVFNRAKADYYFGNYNKALAGFSNFLTRFAASSYAAHALFFQGNIYYLRGDVDKAVKTYIRSYGRAGDLRLDNILEGALAGAVKNAGSVNLNPGDFENLPPDKKCVLIERLAEVLVERQEVVVAKNLLESCGEKLDLSADDYYRTRLTNNVLEVALVLPLSGELQSFGEDIYNGAVIAADFFRQETGRKVKLSSFDTKGDPVGAAQIIRNLANSAVDVIIGPLTSEEAAVASATLNCSNLPLLAPAATQAGLTLLSETSFQLSPNIELQGVQMADYAVLNLDADSAAIITPTSTDELRMSKAFADRFEQLGGKIMAVEYYRPRDKDFGKYIKDIKAISLGAHPDSVFFINEKGDTLDADGIPVYVDCLFLPGNAGQLRLLLAQINFYNLNGAYLGSDGWGNDDIYRLGDDITKQAVFPSPFIEGKSSDENLKFSAAYDARYGIQPPRLAGLGYDAMNIITRAVVNAGTEREALTREIARVNDYMGVAGKVTFGENRENIALPVFKVENGQPVFIGVGSPQLNNPPEEN